MEYFLCRGEWSGPRKGLNPEGWLAWAIGFGVGILPNFGVCEIPMTPVVTFAIGAVVYFVVMIAGLKSENVEKQTQQKLQQKRASGKPDAFFVARTSRTRQSRSTPICSTHFFACASANGGLP